MTSLVEEDYRLAPGLRDGPLAEEERRLVVAMRGLGSSSLAGIIRAWSVPYLFDAMERIFDSGDDPAAGLRASLDQLAYLCQSITSVGLPAAAGFLSAASVPNASEGVAAITGEHFGRLFHEFATERFWEHPLGQLSARLERNGSTR
jgi:hypothetical protein